MGPKKIRELSLKGGQGLHLIVSSYSYVYMKGRMCVSTRLLGALVS